MMKHSHKIGFSALLTVRRPPASATFAVMVSLSDMLK